MLSYPDLLTSAIDIGYHMLINGAEIRRVEDTIQRICTAYHIRQIHVFCIASSIVVSIEDPNGVWHNQSRRIKNYNTDMSRLDLLNQLSRDICSQPFTFEQIQERLADIDHCPVYRLGTQCLIYAMSASAFTVFFGGNVHDAAASFLVGAIVRLILQVLGAMELSQIFTNILCSAISGAICVLTCKIGLGQHLDVIAIGNIMLLIPGVLLTNSFRDFISGDTITGLLHFSEAIITAICVASGFVAAGIMTGGSL